MPLPGGRRAERVPTADRASGAQSIPDAAILSKEAPARAPRCARTHRALKFAASSPHRSARSLHGGVRQRAVKGRISRGGSRLRPWRLSPLTARCDGRLPMESVRGADAKGRAYQSSSALIVCPSVPSASTAVPTTTGPLPRAPCLSAIACSSTRGGYAAGAWSPVAGARSTFLSPTGPRRSIRMSAAQHGKNISSQSVPASRTCGRPELSKSYEQIAFRVLSDCQPSPRRS